MSDHQQPLGGWNGVLRIESVQSVRVPSFHELDDKDRICGVLTQSYWTLKSLQLLVDENSTTCLEPML